MLFFSDPEISVHISFFLNSQAFISSGIKHPEKYFSFLRDTQMLLHILQGVKASAKLSLKLSCPTDDLMHKYKDERAY
jgi:hypothetical protein